jgi:hypothetical protein
LPQAAKTVANTTRYKDLMMHFFMADDFNINRKNYRPGNDWECICTICQKGNHFWLPLFHAKALSKQRPKGLPRTLLCAFFLNLAPSRPPSSGERVRETILQIEKNQQNC